MEKLFYIDLPIYLMRIKMPDIVYAIYNNIVAVVFFGVLIVAGVIYYWQRKREGKVEAKA